MSKLHISIDHGGQRVEFDSPGGDANPEISDEFGGLFDVVTAPVKVVSKVASGVAKGVTKGAKVSVWGIDRFTKNAAKAAGYGAHSLVSVTNKATGEISKAAKSVPVIGKPLHAVVGATLEPVKFSAALASGRRIDKAVVDSFRRSVQSAKTLAPYAQLVVSAVPGIGTGLSAAISGGLVLAEGRSINEATIAAARAAVPGGPLAVAAFDAAVAVGSGKSVSDAAVSAAISAAAPDPASRARLRGALEVASGVSQGKPIDKLALTAASTALESEAQTRVAASIGKPDAQEKAYSELTASIPSTVSRAMVSGVALGLAKEMQHDLHKAVTSESGRESLRKMGAEVIAKSDVLRAAKASVPDAAAFETGIGLMRCQGVTPPAVNYLRDQMSPRGKVSFDSALAVHVGAATNPGFRAGTSDKFKVGYYAVSGALTVDGARRASIVKLLSKNPNANSGAATAVRSVKARRSWWRRMVQWMRMPLSK